MVFCRDCKAKVEDCEHFVSALDTAAVEVFDPKIEALAYKKDAGILEVRFKNGQAWQLFGISQDLYAELLQQTLSSLLKFIANRHNPRPVRSKPQRHGTDGAELVPKEEPCPACHRAMAVHHQTSGQPVRVLWHCERCNQSLWRTYANESVRERRVRYH